MTRPLWTPSPDRAAATHMARFMDQVARERDLEIDGYDALWEWSIREPAAFWESVWRHAGLRAAEPWTAVLEDPVMPGARWFVGARLNFAENLLAGGEEGTAILAVDERGTEPERVSWAELRRRVERLAGFLASRGVVAGDRVAGYLPNRVEAVVAMLASAWLGATWSSCSPEFGFEGVMDRFGQIRPRVLVFTEAYDYGGTTWQVTDRAARVARSIDSIEVLVHVPRACERVHLHGCQVVGWDEALSVDEPVPPAAMLPFDHPVYILYSSGTTGQPKAIVHGAGGTLVQHAKELLLHADLGPSDRILYFTTTGWMMWNWLVSALVTGATVVLYDGHPMHPDPAALWRVVEREGITVLGTSPGYLRACQKAGLHPGRDHDLSPLRAVLSTGAPLSAELFRWVYREVGRDLQLASIAGGTDLISCFMLGSPIDPVYPGEIQKRGLGMAVEAWTPEGEPVVGRKGELVCVEPFPSMPVGFWNDPDGSRYRAAYFEHFPGVWRHGDWVEITPRGGVIVHGRSDATLNPGGVRIGTAEIYRQVESMDEVVDSIVVGVPAEDDVEVVLYVVLREDVVLDEALRAAIVRRIRTRASPRHVPDRVIQAPGVPRTLSGKKVELAVQRVVRGEEPGNRSALSNPEVLDWYAGTLGTG